MKRRGHQREHKNYRHVGRDTIAISNRRLHQLLNVGTYVLKKQNLRDYEDRRTWNPDKYTQPARSFSQTRHRLIAVRSKGITQSVPNRYQEATWETVPQRVGFQNPDRVLICVRRKQRREIIHALGVAGRKGLKKPKFNVYSEVRC